MAADNNTASCVREMPLLNSLGANGDAPATRRLPRRRNLVRNALREVEQQWWLMAMIRGDPETRHVEWTSNEHSETCD